MTAYGSVRVLRCRHHLHIWIPSWSDQDFIYGKRRLRSTRFVKPLVLWQAVNRRQARV